MTTPPLTMDQLFIYIQKVDRGVWEELRQQRGRLQTLEKDRVLVEALREALAWCRVDAANEDSYPTQEMFDNRIEVIRNALTGEVADE